MILAKDFEDFVRLLNKHQVEYMVVGGYAMAFHGRPRYTGDFDIWVNISEGNASRLLKVISDFGMASLGFVKNDFLRPGYMSQIGRPPLRIDILNSVDGIQFEDAYKNKEIIQGMALEVPFIGLDDLLINRMASGRKRDIDDVKAIRKIVPKNILKPKKGLKR